MIYFQCSGVLTISIAAIEDIVVWIIVAIATALSKGGPTIEGLYTLLLTFAFVFVMFVVVRPLLALVYRYYQRQNDETNLYLIVICLLILLAASFISELIHIHAFFGSFLAGLVIPRGNQPLSLQNFLSIRIELFCIEFFLPLYFTNSGLKTHLYLLNTFQSWYILLALVCIASISKILPLTLITKLFTRKTQTWSYALAVGILMNTRGIVQLVVLNIGVELGVLSPVVFSIFVLTAVILTFLTSPLLYFVYLRKKKSHLVAEKREDISQNEPLRKWRLESSSQL